MAAEQYFPGLEGVIAGETAVATIEGGLRYRGYPIEQLADDASFRRYERLDLDGRPAVLMDAPPDTQPLGPFIAIAAALAREHRRPVSEDNPFLAWERQVSDGITAWLEDAAVVEVMLNPDGRLWVDQLADGLIDTLLLPNEF